MSAGKPREWQAGDQVVRTYTRDADGRWIDDAEEFSHSDAYVDKRLSLGHLALPHLSPRPDAVVEPVWLHAGRAVEPHAGEPGAGSLYIQPGTKAVEADCATCGDAVVRQERRATPAPAPVDDREALACRLCGGGDDPSECLGHGRCCDSCHDAARKAIADVLSEGFIRKHKDPRLANADTWFYAAAVLIDAGYVKGGSGR